MYIHTHVYIYIYIYIYCTDGNEARGWEVIDKWLKTQDALMSWLM